MVLTCHVEAVLMLPAPFTLLNFPEGTLFNRANPVRARLVADIKTLDKHPLMRIKQITYCKKHAHENVHV